MILLFALFFGHAYALVTNAVNPPCETFLHKGSGLHPLIGLSAESGYIESTKLIKIAGSQEVAGLGHQLVYLQVSKTSGFSSSKDLRHFVQNHPGFAKRHKIEIISFSRMAVPDLDLANRLSSLEQQRSGRAPIYILPVTGQYSSDEFISAWSERRILEASGNPSNEHFHDVFNHRYGFFLLPTEFVNVTVELAALIQSLPMISQQLRDDFVQVMDLSSSLSEAYVSNDRIPNAKGIYENTLRENQSQLDIFIAVLRDSLKGQTVSGAQRDKLNELERRTVKFDLGQMAAEVWQQLDME